MLEKDRQEIRGILLSEDSQGLNDRVLSILEWFTDSPKEVDLIEKLTKLEFTPVDDTVTELLTDMPTPRPEDFDAVKGLLKLLSLGGYDLAADILQRGDFEGFMKLTENTASQAEFGHMLLKDFAGRLQRRDVAAVSPAATVYGGK